MIEIVIYNTEKHECLLGIIDHFLKTASHIMHYEANVFPVSKLNEAYHQWNEWTTNNKSLIRFEE